jgi:rhodanese-related sulfurtransferase
MQPMIKTISALLTAATLILISTAALSADYKRIGLEKFAALVKAANQGKRPSLLLDVRSGAEFYAGHIQGTDHAPFKALRQYQIFLPDKSRPLVVFCRTNNRASVWADELNAKGYDVTLYTGGILEWIKSGRELSNLFMGKFRVTEYHKQFLGQDLDPFEIRLGQPGDKTGQ